LASKFRRELEVAGFAITRDAVHADVIVAHSGGCFVLPKTYQAKLVLVVGLPCWPGKSTLQTLCQKIWLDMHSHEHTAAEWLVKTFWNSLYFWNMLYNYQMWRGQQRGAHRTITNAVLVRNKDDATCTPDYTHFRFKHTPPLVSFAGQHDDLWHHPRKYIDLIRHYHG
jgi:hypothetical protein